MSLVGLLFVLGGSACLEPYCERDSDCRSGEQCLVSTNRCVRADADTAWPVDGSTPTDGSVQPDAGGCEVTGCQAPTPICDTASGECVECTDSATHCSGDKPICNLTTHQCEGCTTGTQCEDLNLGTPGCDNGPCVECTDSAAHCLNPGQAVCDQGSHSCRACEIHAECDHFGGVCDQGICLAESEITYVNRSASCPGTGERSTPYCEIKTAVETDDPTLIILADAGAYRAITVNNQIIWIIGSEPNVVIDGNVGNSGDGVTVEHLDISHHAELTLENLSILGETGVTAAALSCSASFGTPRVRLLDVSLPGGDTFGLQVTDCDVTMIGGSITGHSHTPILAQRTELQLDRVNVADNTGGGISLNESPFTIENTFVARNGDGGVNIPGIGVLDPTGTSVLRHVTVVGNDISDSAPYNSGIACLGSTCAIVEVDSCLLADNPDGVLGPAFTANYTLIKDGYGVSAGTGNFQNDPAFVSSTDPHITGSSPCRGAGNPSSPVTHDYDGDARPNPAGTPPDCGADEVP